MAKKKTTTTPKADTRLRALMDFVSPIGTMKTGALFEVPDMPLHPGGKDAFTHALIRGGFAEPLTQTDA